MKFKLKTLLISAALISMATLLSHVKLFSMPAGGSVTLLSMFFATLPGYFFGWKVGILSGVVYGAVQFAVEPWFVHPIQIALDYIFAFAALGFSGFFTKGERRLQIGYVAAVFGRFFFSALAGYIFYSEMGWSFWEKIVMSVAYNAQYTVVEAVITLVVASVPAFKTFLKIAEKRAHA
jgi:thiamine transporter